jgi:hypothetical protein
MEEQLKLFIRNVIIREVLWLLFKLKAHKRYLVGIRLLAGLSQEIISKNHRTLVLSTLFLIKLNIRFIKIIPIHVITIVIMGQPLEEAMIFMLLQILEGFLIQI